VSVKESCRQAPKKELRKKYYIEPSEDNGGKELFNIDQAETNPKGTPQSAGGPTWYRLRVGG